MKSVFDEKFSQNVLNKIGMLIVNEAKKRCVVDKGVLRNSIKYEVVGDDTVKVYSEVPYANFVEFGTGVYHLNEEGGAKPKPGWDVKPIHSKSLVFKVNGETVFAKKVHVEGMRAQPFLRPAIHQNMSAIRKIISEGVD